MKGIHQYTSLSRTIDPKYSTNIAIAVWVALFFVVALGIKWVGSMEFWPGLLWSGGASIAVFVAWGLGRELDPDYEASAFLAAAFTSIFSFYQPLPGLLFIIVWMMSVRMLVRTTGMPAKTTDGVIIFLLGALLVLDEQIFTGLALTLLFTADALLEKPLKRQLIFALGILGITILYWAIGLERSLYFRLDTLHFILTGITALLFIFRILLLYRPASQGDVVPEYISRKRLQTAQVLTLLLALSVTLAYGKAGLYQTMPLWCVMAAVGSMKFFGR